MILGEGRERPHLTALAEALGITTDLALPGFVANPYGFLARCQVFAHPSRFEGSPIVVMEAVGLGANIVCSDCPSGPTEILQGGRYGRLFKVGDVAGLAHALRAALDTPMTPAWVREAARPFQLDESVAAYLAALGLSYPGKAAMDQR